MIELRTFATADAAPDVLGRIRVLMDTAFDDFTEHDWEHTRGMHVVAFEGDEVVGHGAVTDRTLWVDGTPWRAGYVEGVAVAPARQQTGVGTRVVTEVVGLIRSGYQLGALGTGEHGFYERLGWEVWRGPTSVRTPAAGGSVTEVPSPDDDGYVMVLRFGPSAGLGLDLPIACESRSGDDW